MGNGKKVIPLLQRLQQLANRVTTPSARGSEPQISSSVVPKQLNQTRSSAQAATAVAQKPQAKFIQVQSLAFAQVPAVKTDLFGAISAVTEGSSVEEGVFKNVDGHRYKIGSRGLWVGEAWEVNGHDMDNATRVLQWVCL